MTDTETIWITQDVINAVARILGYSQINSRGLVEVLLRGGNSSFGIVYKEIVPASPDDQWYVALGRTSLIEANFHDVRPEHIELGPGRRRFLHRLQEYLRTTLTSPDLL